MKKLFIGIGGLVLIAVVAFLINNKPWMLSLYSNGSTILRINYGSKDVCLDKGRDYISQGNADRFDCGYKCSSSDLNNLQLAPICKQVCDDAGCRL